jgi:Uma2 family endonuclease
METTSGYHAMSDMAMELPIRPITVLEFERMAELGIIGEDERVELLDGMLVTMPPLSLGHGFVQAFAITYLNESLRPAYFASGSISVPLGDLNEPQPDIVIFPRELLKETSRKRPRNEDIVAVVEIANTSLRRDSILKARIYARFGVREYLVVDVVGRQVIRFREPANEGYRVTEKFSALQKFELLGVPGISLDVGAFFPPD